MSAEDWSYLGVNLNRLSFGSGVYWIGVYFRSPGCTVVVIVPTTLSFSRVTRRSTESCLWALKLLGFCVCQSLSSWGRDVRGNEYYTPSTRYQFKFAHDPCNPRISFFSLGPRIVKMIH